jgi:hypothetical protein
MELSGRPLFDNPLDAQLFIEREETERIKANCRHGINTFLYGPRGIGKTTLLRQALFQLREEGFPAIGVDAAPAESALELIKLVAAAVSPGVFRTPTLNPISAAGLGETGAILAELRQLHSSGRKERTAILLDLPSGNRDVHRLFGKFRDELWQLPYTWIVAAPSTLRMELLTPPANAFFEDTMELSPLSADQQIALIEVRLDPGESTPWRLPTGGEGNPRRLLEVVRDSIRAGGSPQQRLQAQVTREAEVSELGRSASMLYSELADFGPASASDPAFLKRLGWSRQRAAKILSELETKGFVSSEMRAADNGRPRKVFAIVPLEPR